MNADNTDRFKGKLAEPPSPPQGVGSEFSPQFRGTLARRKAAPAVGSIATGTLHGKFLTVHEASEPPLPAPAELDAIPGSELPTFTKMLPEANSAKTYRSRNVELRQSSTRDHQDGIAHNPRTETIAISDGMGGVGQPGNTKDYLGFALAHAAAEVEDILALQDADSVNAMVERSKELLAHMGIAPEDDVESALFSGGWGAGRHIEWGATLAVVQKVPDTEDMWRMAVFGDSSVAKLDESGKIQEGFGECFQLIERGQAKADGRAEEEVLGSYIGIAKKTLGGFVQYGAGGLHATFATVRLKPGQKLVVTSDAYVQKTPPITLEADAKLTNEEWAAKAPQYDDDTSLAVITA
jgi:hypothetical protein